MDMHLTKWETDLWHGQDTIYEYAMFDLWTKGSHKTCLRTLILLEN